MRYGLSSVTHGEQQPGSVRKPDTEDARGIRSVPREVFHVARAAREDGGLVHSARQRQASGVRGDSACDTESRTRVKAGSRPTGVQPRQARKFA